MLVRQPGSTVLAQVLSTLDIPVGCGWKGCEDVVFGVQPLPVGDHMMRWEHLLQSHKSAAGHRYAKLREVCGA